MSEHDVLTHEKEHWARGLLVAGLDEAGRGAWAGPVVAGAVLLPPEPARLREALAGVDDSKRLSSAARERLDVRIREVAETAVGVVEAAIIDEIGILPATFQAMQAAVAALPRRPDFLLIDHIPRALGQWPQKRLVRGETASLSIAAASIIAKVYRDRLLVALDAQYPGYGLARHKGYGTKQHRQALAQLGPAAIHRTSWAPFRQPPLPFDEI
jgi:ribonuclease HII